jgi:hypothetical protein
MAKGTKVTAAQTTKRKSDYMLEFLRRLELERGRLTQAELLSKQYRDDARTYAEIMFRWMPDVKQTKGKPDAKEDRR